MQVPLCMIYTSSGKSCRNSPCEVRASILQHRTPGYVCLAGALLWSS